MSLVFSKGVTLSLGFVLSYALPLRPLPFKSGLARSWVRLALGSRRPPLLPFCFWTNWECILRSTGHPSLSLLLLSRLSPVSRRIRCRRRTLVSTVRASLYPSYPDPVYTSYAVIWERETLGKWKVSNGAKSGKEKS